MEIVGNLNDVKSLNNNKIIGKPVLNNSEIIFGGKGNILYCEDDVILSDTSIRFSGDNSVVYLSSSNSSYFLNLIIKNDSIIFIGKNNKFYPIVNIAVSNNQNLIIGCDCIIESNVTLGNMHEFELVDLNSKETISSNKSIYIGDHVSICSNSFISGDVEIGSGAILNSYTYVPNNSSLNSNTLYCGNPFNAIKNNVSFIVDDESINKDIMFGYNKSETLSSEKINQVLDKVESDDVILVLQEIFIENKMHDRFSI